MGRRLVTLERLLEIYETVEELREIEAQRAAADVGEAERAIGRQVTLARDAAGEERQALERCDRMGWSCAMVQQRVANVRRKVLGRVLVEREKQSAAARNRHMDSRLRSARIKTLVDGMKREHEEQEHRRLQALADERYLTLRRSRTNARVGGDE